MTEDSETAAPLDAASEMPSLTSEPLAEEADTASVAALEQPNQNTLQAPSEELAGESTEPTEPTAHTDSATPAALPTEPIKPPTGSADLLAQHPTSKRAKWFLPALAAGVILVLGGGAYGYFGVFMQSPSQVWKTALKNTADGYKKFAQTMPATKKGAKANGSFKVTQPVVADGTMTLNSDQKNFKLVADAGTSGVRATFNLMGIASSGTTPDLYVKVNGVSGIGSLLGSGTGTAGIGTTLTAIDDKWFLVDHTLLDQAVTNTGGGASQSITTESAQQIQSDLQDINKKVAAVVSDRLLSTDPKKAVVIIKQQLGQQDFKGRGSLHYKVAVQKTQLRDMAVALKDALKDTKLKTWLGSNNTTKTFEQALQFDDLLKSIDAANYDKAVAEVWVDAQLKYVRNVRINAIDAKGANSGAIDFTLDYTGGDDLPLSVNVSSNGASNKGTFSVGLNVNKKTSAAKFTANIDGMSGNQKVAGKAELLVQSSDESVTVVKPDSAKNLVDLIAPLLGQFQGGLPNTSTPAVKTTAQ